MSVAEVVLSEETKRRCNPMIGYGNDDPIILRKAADYLESGGTEGVIG